MLQKIGLYKTKTAKGTQWRVRWFGDYDATGSRKRYSRTFELKKDAEQFKDGKKAEFAQGVSRDPCKATLKEYCQSWIYNKQHIESIRPASVILYNETFERLYKAFGERCLICDIDKTKAERFLAGLQPLKRTEKSLSAWTRQRILRHCKTLFKAIPNNPFKDIKGGKCAVTKWYYMKAAEYHKLLEVTPSLHEKVFYSLCYTCGLRKTEALALRWCDIDFEKGRLHVVNQPDTDKLPGFFIKDSEERIIPIPKHTLDMLTKLHLQADSGIPYVLLTVERFDKIKDKWQDCRKTGKAWLGKDWKNNVCQSFTRRVKNAGIDTAGKKFSVHILRKCCIQNWQNSLPMNVVKSFAGHADISTTERFYSTVDESQFVNAAKMTDLFLTFSPDSEGNLNVEHQCQER